MTLGGAASTWTWQQAASTGPSARYDHAVGWDIDNNRIVLFGGRDLTSLLDLTTWRLKWDPDSVAFRWTTVSTPTEDSLYGKPARRHRHAVMYDKDWKQLTIFGGDTSATTPLRSGEVWALDFFGGTVKWKRVLTASTPTPPAARAGHTVLYDLNYQTARLPERYNPAGGSAGTWTVLGSAQYGMALYPFMFQMPDRKVIYAGPWGSANASQPYLPDPATDQWLSNHIGSEIRMGSAVMYRPGKIMRCGALSPGDGNPGHNRTDTLFYSPPGSSRWDEVADDPEEGGQLLARTNHNLTVLPTGQVLVTGGLTLGDTSNYQRNPQIWTPRSEGGGGVWSDSLNDEPVTRNYHSAAILLPDARVLTSGGENPNANRFKVTMFSPPYLFNSSGGIAQRPHIIDYKRRVQYGQTFTVCVDSFTAISSICLIRPGAVTHGFNQDQRFVPLSFVSADNPTRFLVSAPPNGATAPPGDYLLFVLDATGASTRVPSIGKWLRLGPHTNDLCDAVRPARVGGLTATVPCNDAESMDLAWTAPADDTLLAASDKAWLYEVRYSSSGPSADTVAWFNSATSFAPVVAPEAVGTSQDQTVVLLSANTSYWFGVRAVDDNGNPGVPQVVKKKTLYIDCEGGFSGGGGGGGGSSLRRIAGSFGLAEQGATPVAPGNSLVEGGAPGIAGEDVYRLPQAAQDGGVTYGAWLRTSDGEAVSVDRVRLRIVDHALDDGAYVAGGQTVAGVRVAAARVLDGEGGDLTDELDSAEGLTAVTGTSLTLEFDGPASNPTILVIEATRASPRGHPDSSGIEIQVPDGESWLPIARHHPRRVRDEAAFEVASVERVRLRFASDIYLHFAGHLAAEAGTTTTRWVLPSIARHASGGDALDAIADHDSLAVALAGPDTLDLGLDLPVLDAGFARTHFLEGGATRVTSHGPQASSLRPVAESAPMRFALYQNRPNPFSAVTALRFDLPSGAQVRLAIYDVQGRNLRVLSDRWFPAGAHAVLWDGCDGSGARLGPGIYFYRIEAGPYRDRRKMVRLP